MPTPTPTREQRIVWTIRRALKCRYRGEVVTARMSAKEIVQAVDIRAPRNVASLWSMLDLMVATGELSQGERYTTRGGERVYWLAGVTVHPRDVE